MFDIPADIFFRYRSDRFHIIGMIRFHSSPFQSWFLISGKRSKSFLPEIPFRYFTIAVMDNFGGADTKQCTWSPSPHSNRWTVKPLSSAIMKYLKGISGRKLFERFPEIRNQLWKGELWNHSYYVEMVGSVSEENIRRYIEHQSKAY